MGKRTNKRMQRAQVEVAEPDLFGDEFFSTPPAASHHGWDEDADDHDAPTTVAPEKRRAMIATLAIFGVLATAVGGFTVYSKLIMPTPVALGASSAVLTLPTAPTYVEPMAAASAVAPVAPAPVAPLAAAPVIAAVDPAPVLEASAVVATAVVATAGVATAALPATTVESAAPAASRARDKQHVRRDSERTRAGRADNAAASASSSDNNSLSAQAMRQLNGGHPREARVLAQQAVQQNPERADGWIVLGAAHDALGDRAAAMNAYATCTARAFGPRVSACRALAR